MTDPTDFHDLMGDDGTDRPLPSAVRTRMRARVLPAAVHRPSTAGGPRVVIMLSATTVSAVVLLAALLLRSLSPSPVSDAASMPGPWPASALKGHARFWSSAEVNGARTGWAPASATHRCSTGAAPSSVAPSAHWRPILTASARGVTVIAYQVGRQRIFCELTPATVTLSAPADDESASTAQVTFFSRMGSAAGFVPDAVDSVLLSADDTPSADDAAVVAGGVFIRPNAFAADRESLRVTVREAARQHSVTDDLATARGAVGPTRTDVEQPIGDRTSASGARLGRCLTGAGGPPVADAGNWQPGAVASTGHQQTFQTAYYGHLLAVCSLTGDDVGEFRVVEGRPGETHEPALAASPAIRTTASVFYDFKNMAGGGSASDTIAIAGLLKARSATSVSLTRPTSATLTAAVRNGTFVLAGVRLNEKGDKTTRSSVFSVRDAAGTVLATVRLD